MCRYPWRPHKGIGSPEARVRRSYEQPNMAPGNPSQVL